MAQPGLCRVALADRAALVSFRGFLAALIWAFAAVILLIIGLGSGDSRWSYALSLAVLEAARSGLWMLRRHRRAARYPW